MHTSIRFAQTGIAALCLTGCATMVGQAGQVPAHWKNVDANGCVREATQDTTAWGQPVEKGRALAAVCGGAFRNKPFTAAKYAELIYHPEGYAWGRPINGETWEKVRWVSKSSGGPEATSYVEMVWADGLVGLRPVTPGATEGAMVLDAFGADGDVVTSLEGVVRDAPKSLQPLTDGRLLLRMGPGGEVASTRVLGADRKLETLLLPPDSEVYQSRYALQGDLRVIAVPIGDDRFLLRDVNGEPLQLQGARSWRPMAQPGKRWVYGWLAEFGASDGDVEWRLTRPDGVTVVADGIDRVELSPEWMNLGNWAADLVLFHPDGSVFAIPLGMLNREHFHQTRPRTPDTGSVKWARLDARQLRQQLSDNASRHVAEWQAAQRQLKRDDAARTWHELWSKSHHTWDEHSQLLAAARTLGANELLAYGERYRLADPGDIRRACSTGASTAFCQQARRQEALDQCLANARDAAAASYAGAVRAGEKPVDGTWTGTWSQILQREEQRCR